MKHLITRGDILFVDLENGIGSEQNGNRPGVIIQNDAGNRHSPTVILAPTSTAVKKLHQPTHVFLPAKFGLSEPSIILLEQIRTVDKRRLGTYIGHLDKTYIQALNKAIEVSVGLKAPPRKRLQSPPEQALMTLCGRCLDLYWRTNAFYIRRADPSQFSKEICTFCGTRMGFDYFLTPKNVEAQKHDQS